MYLGFYGLNKEPFHITPDPEFLFLSPSHKEAFAAVTYGIAQRKGFVVLTGEVGTGKTTVLRAYLDELDRNKVDCLYLFNPNLTFEELLRLLLEELGHQAAERTESSMLQAIHWALVERYKAQRNVAIVIDEAQHMPVETLEKLRMLSNIETTKDKLIQIVLVGQPELDQKLDRHMLRQLKQRVALRATIRPLTRDESAAYIRHRLAQAGANVGDVFTATALKTIIRYGKGVPRTLNIACSNALVAGYGSQRRPVTKRIVREVIADLRGESFQPRRVSKWLLAAATAVAIGAAATLVYIRLPHENAGAATPPPPPPQAAPTPVAAQEPATPPPMPPPLPAPAPTVAAIVFPPPPFDTLIGEEEPLTMADTPSSTSAKEKEPETPVEASPEPPPAVDKTFPVTRVVKRGDWLIKLVREVYGSSNDDLMNLVRQHNPQIRNSDILQTGTKIVFPKVPEPNDPTPAP